MGVVIYLLVCIYYFWLSDFRDCFGTRCAVHGVFVIFFSLKASLCVCRFFLYLFVDSSDVVTGLIFSSLGTFSLYLFIYLRIY